MPALETKTKHFVDVAKDWNGTPFRHKGSRKGVGADCLGLVLGALKEAGHLYDFIFPDYGDPDQREAHKALSPDILRPILRQKKSAELAIGDVLVFELTPRVYWHLGILINSDDFISAWRQTGVGTRKLDDYWRARIHSVFKLKET